MANPYYANQQNLIGEALARALPYMLQTAGAKEAALGQAIGGGLEKLGGAASSMIEAPAKAKEKALDMESKRARTAYESILTDRAKLEYAKDKQQDMGPKNPKSLKKTEPDITAKEYFELLEKGLTPEQVRQGLAGYRSAVKGENPVLSDTTPVGTIKSTTPGGVEVETSTVSMPGMQDLSKFSKDEISGIRELEKQGLRFDPSYMAMVDERAGVMQLVRDMPGLGKAGDVVPYKGPMAQPEQPTPWGDLKNVAGTVGMGIPGVGAVLGGVDAAQQMRDFFIRRYGLDKPQPTRPPANPMLMQQIGGMNLPVQTQW